MMNTSILSRIYRSRLVRVIAIVLGLIVFVGTALIAWLAPGFAIREAAASGHLGVIRMLLACDPHLASSADAFSQTPLHYAVANGQTDAAKLLLANGADIEAKTYLGATPLDVAAGAEDTAMMEVLLANHADIDGTDRHGFQQSPLFNAVLEHHKVSAEFLVQHHANVNAPDYCGRTPLTMAVDNDDKDMVGLLLRNHANVNAQDKDGTMALHLAVSAAFYQHDKELIKLLLANHADVQAKGKDGTPLQMAIGYKMDDVAELLRAHGAQE